MLCSSFQPSSLCTVARCAAYCPTSNCYRSIAIASEAVAGPEDPRRRTVTVDASLPSASLRSTRRGQVRHRGRSSALRDTRANNLSTPTPPAASFRPRPLRPDLAPLVDPGGHARAPRRRPRFPHPAHPQRQPSSQRARRRERPTARCAECARDRQGPRRGKVTSARPARRVRTARGAVESGWADAADPTVVAEPAAKGANDCDIHGHRQDRRTCAEGSVAGEPGNPLRMLRRCPADCTARAQKKNKLPRARAGPSTSSSTSLAAPKPASKTRRTSRSPIPDGPPHAPHILAAHRRASVSPNPTQAAAETAKNTLANSSTSAPADSQNTATSAAKTSRKKTSRARPRPSELLPAPLGPPGSEGDDTDVDELLLLPPEKTRGRGEGKTRPHPHPPAHRRSTESREPILSQSSMQSVKREGSAEVATAGAQAGTSAPIEMSFSVTAPSSDGAFAASAGTFAPVATIDEEANGGLPVAEDQADDLYVDRDMGGYDGHDIYDDWQAEPTAQPVSAIGADEIGADGAGELVVAQAESAGFEEPEPMEGARRFADLNDASSGSEFGEGDEPADEEDGALADPADGEQLSDAEPEDIVDDSAEQSAAHQTFEAENEAAQQTQQDAEDIDGNPSEAEAEALDASTFDFPASSARRSRPSYPPLSPDRTGEFDDVVPVRMGSPSPEPEMKPEPEPEPEPELELELEAFAKEVSEASLRSVSRETDTRPTPVKANEPDVFALAEAAGPAVPSSAVRSFPLHGTPSVLPALLRPSTFFPANTRSPSPAFASPHPLPSPAARPTLQFASPRLPRERYPSAAPSALSDRKFEGSSLRFAPESSPAKSWTRGPAFFRSSSFSPPAHAALPKTATLFERHPGGAAARSRARGDGGAADQSRDYRRSVGLETSSPVAGATSSPGGGGMSASGRRQSHEPEPEPDEEEDADGVDEVGQEEEAHQSALSRRRSPTFADASDEVRQEQSPRRQTASGSSEASDPGDISDGSVRSPARSVTGDVRMSTPSPRHSSSSERDQPSTPREASPSNADCRMASPSPARNENTRAQGSLLRARFGEFVEGSKSRIQGMLFGSPNKQAVPQPTAAAGVDAAARSMSAQRTEASRSEQIDSLQEGAEEPFADPKLHPTGVPAGADSTFSLHAQSGSGETFLSNASRLSRRRSRPSHPTLPVIEISSTDAHAAARAAAILKVYHKYVEQGVEAVDLEQLVAAEQAGAAFDRIVAPRDLSQRDDHDDEEEEELRTLLLDAEDEVRDLVPGLINTRAPTEVCAPASFDRDSTPAEAPRTWTSRDWRRLEQALVEVSRRRLRAASVLTTTTTGMSMTSEAIANASVTGEEVDPEDVIEAFLWKWKVDPDSLEGDWARSVCKTLLLAYSAGCLANECRFGPQREARHPDRGAQGPTCQGRAFKAGIYGGIRAGSPAARTGPVGCARFGRRPFRGLRLGLRRLGRG